MTDRKETIKLAIQKMKPYHSRPRRRLFYSHRYNCWVYTGHWFSVKDLQNRYPPTALDYFEKNFAMKFETRNRVIGPFARLIDAIRLMLK